MELSIRALAGWKGAAGITFARGSQYVFFGLLWLVSFSVAWRLVNYIFATRIHR